MSGYHVAAARKIFRVVQRLPVLARSREPGFPSGNPAYGAAAWKQSAQCPMPIIATPSRRRTAMAVMLALAMSGLVIRYFAPDPSMLRDFGTLLMVMWLPAVGNFAAYLIGKIPRPPPRVVEFTRGAAFEPHLQVRLEATHAKALETTALGHLQAHAVE